MDKCHTYTVNILRLKEGGFVVTVPSLPGCHTWGKTYTDAVANAKEAIEGFLEFLKKTGRPIPALKRHYRKVHIVLRLPA